MLCRGAAQIRTLCDHVLAARLAAAINCGPAGSAGWQRISISAAGGPSKFVGSGMQIRMIGPPGSVHNGLAGG